MGDWGTDWDMERKHGYNDLGESWIQINYV